MEAEGAVLLVENARYAYPRAAITNSAVFAPEYCCCPVIKFPSCIPFIQMRGVDGKARWPINLRDRHPPHRHKADSGDRPFFIEQARCCRSANDAGSASPAIPACCQSRFSGNPYPLPLQCRIWFERLGFCSLNLSILQPVPCTGHKPAQCQRHNHHPRRIGG